MFPLLKKNLFALQLFPRLWLYAQCCESWTDWMRHGEKLLPEFGYSETEIDTICGMILATKFPQQPHNRLEEIMCDADLDYLGRPDFFSIGNTLFEELKSREPLLLWKNGINFRLLFSLLTNILPAQQRNWETLKKKFIFRRWKYVGKTINREDTTSSNHFRKTEIIFLLHFLPIQTESSTNETINFPYL